MLHCSSDGGFAYSVQEWETMWRLDLPIVSIILNNDTFAWIKHVEKARLVEQYISVDFHHVDFATVAKGFGARGHNAKTASELAAALDHEKSPQGPALIDIATDQWETSVLRTSSGGKN